ncbi:MAG TPA: NADH-quinone oxidoreductase subunit NuoK [Caldisericia bacterium]|jgi:NADH:ubiquinone oxidoreductase subunit K|nr:NADH-quinone oxidoreductase subunit NuoK [Caldisericia bacterium]HOC79012.1 NADH-quinone oxidoreductase subunit NuoK [Caldisericia bacterium]HOG69812.1 NADH-quinone oxidoreductase subunit NuoK [Caldisericia bacterium]HPA65297.1 NADH-quinone oxidoreductase subunit NuoK [Caldisericia bacterium]HPM44757.1 NADH-quinone oxidoreductase subunit NuoK [Caldisericia bacterium]
MNYLLLILGAAIFSFGVLGALTLRNAIRILMCIELMLNGANLTFIATASQLPDPGLAQSMVVFAIAIAASETIVGLGAIVAMYRAKGWVTLEQFSLLKW